MFLPSYVARAVLVALICFFGAPQRAVSAEVSPTPKRSASSKRIDAAVDSVVVDVNGERRRVAAKEGFTAVRGDLVTIVEVVILNGANLKPKVDVVGFNRKESRAINDLSRVIDTGRDLDRGVSQKDGGSRYNIRIFGDGLQRTTLAMILVDPRLESFEVEVNGKRQRLTHRDTLILSPSDQVRVLDLRTNVRGNDNVTHDLISRSGSLAGGKKELIFSRGTIVFARIPIEWKGS
jgi:hypothetical protein